VTPEALIATARKYKHVVETSYNSGPYIDDWLKFVHQQPGASWCAAYACAMIHETDPATDFKFSASALSLLEKNPGRIIDAFETGCLVVWAHDPKKHTGHVGIGTGSLAIAGQLVTIDVIAGNTTPDGHSRDGKYVAEKTFIVPDPHIAGYLRTA
jgi:hypothetical protein